MNPILDRFEQTVQRFPEKPAVTCRDEFYTFSQLKDTAQKLATSISESGTKESPIGVLVSRGCSTTVFFLSVLYSGNFYVPLDPDIPHAKLAKILTDAEISLVLCEEKQKALLKEIGFKSQALTLKNQADKPAMAPESTDDTPAYLIYTSGSTGEPKGVLKSQGAIVDFIETYTELFQLGADEIIGNQTPFFFDASAKDFYQMLFTGATLDVIPSELFVFPKTLIEYLNEKKISYICWVPTALAAVTQLNTFQEVLPTTLKKVFFVGETFPIKQLRKWMEALPKLQYVNVYGSTELAGVCCYYELPVPYDADQIPIGQALPDCKTYLVDSEDGHFITEPGMIGELYVTGSTLALSYYRDPEKTAQTFVSLPFPDVTTTRALKTGDLAKYDSDGNLLFLSRDDDQIKHTGHRIELGEIETVVNQLAEINQCCCLYNEQKQQINLFCVLTDGCNWDRKALRHALKDQLSDYMLPNKYYILDSLPLNANSKVDRMKLKEMYF